MQTLVRKIHHDNIENNMNVIKTAADILLDGGLVAFPTETVYGLGANALNPLAVKKIFDVKGRPSDNPLIIHISSIDELEFVAQDISLLAYKLADEFWPGPLTLILKKSKNIPYETTAGLETVAVRMPNCNAALSLIKEAGIPIAAPSANSSGKPSSTLSTHIENDLSGKIDMIIDNGQSSTGIESTVVDLTVTPPVILRPGSITLDMLKKIEPTIKLAPNTTDNKPKSPGMKYTHYSPAAKLMIISGDNKNVIYKINDMISKQAHGKKPGVLTCDEHFESYDLSKTKVISVGKCADMESIAANLYKTLRDFDTYDVDIIYSEAFPNHGLGFSIMDRLLKAAGNTVINV